MGCRQKLFTVLLIISAVRLYAQSPEFLFPLDTTAVLSGTFGEFRGSHFHAGIDIKTFGKVGLPVRAAADGYVSRIKISPYGYGKAIYLTHENGHTTVYGHLSRFETGLEAYIRRKQYARHSYSIEIFPKRNEFRIKAGDIIAWSGNSGGSYAPHLHFEIRDSRTQEILDPLSFSLPVVDTLPPVLNAVQVWNRDRSYKVRTGIYPKVAEQEGIHPDTLHFSLTTGIYGLALSARDFMVADTSNTLGIYSVEITEGSREHYKREFSRFSFSDGKYIHQVSYYEPDLPPIELCFTETWQPHRMADYDQQGWFTLSQEIPERIFRVSLKDAYGNETVRHLVFQWENRPPGNWPIPEAGDQAKLLFKDEVTLRLKGSNHYIDFFRNSLLDSLWVHARIEAGGCDTLVLLPEGINIMEKFRIAYSLPQNLPAAPEKLCLARKTENGNEYVGGDISTSYIQAYTRETGAYFMSCDTLAPEVELLLINRDSILVRVKDNFSGLYRYKASMDQRWFLMEYDPKSNELYGDLSGYPSGSKLDFRLFVTDNRENSYTYRKTLILP